MRILAVDYGDRRVGLAVSDELGIAAHGLPTILVRSAKQAANMVVATANEKEAERIVVGLPLNMDGSSGPRVTITEAFCDLCRKRTKIPIETYDERLSSRQAEQVMSMGKKKPSKHKSSVDQVAATIILQDYLEYSSR
jgi:putative holliday junction resolvase